MIILQYIGKVFSFMHKDISETHLNAMFVQVQVLTIFIQIVLPVMQKG